jgi:hypothetical protein
MENKKIVLILNSFTKGLSGGDRILVNLADKATSLFDNVEVVSNETGVDLWKGYISNKKNLTYRILPTKKYENKSLFSLYLARLMNGIKYFSKNKMDDGNFLYSCSDFWPSSIPAIIAKIKNPKIKWVAGFYLFAPAPWQKDSPYKTSFKRRLIGMTYWLMQRPIYWMVKGYADYVFVTSEPDVSKFITKKRDKSKIVIVQGGVDITESEK